MSHVHVSPTPFQTYALENFIPYLLKPHFNWDIDIGLTDRSLFPKVELPVSTQTNPSSNLNYLLWCVRSFKRNYRSLLRTTFLFSICIYKQWWTVSLANLFFDLVPDGFDVLMFTAGHPMLHFTFMIWEQWVLVEISQFYVLMFHLNKNFIYFWKNSF